MLRRTRRGSGARTSLYRSLDSFDEVAGLASSPSRFSKPAEEGKAAGEPPSPATKPSASDDPETAELKAKVRAGTRVEGHCDSLTGRYSKSTATYGIFFAQLRPMKSS